jgi:hypothetical protein
MSSQATAPNSDGGPPVRFGHPSARGAGSPGFGWTGAVVGVLAVVAILAALAWSGAAGKTVSAKQPHIFGGDLVLEDARPLSVIDVATAQVTVKLTGIDAQVGATSYSDVETVPVEEGTMLVNTKTGTFNLLGHDDYVLDAGGSGVGLGSLSGMVGARGYGAGQNAYIVRSAPHSTVSLVDQQTVTAAAKAQASPSISSGSGAKSTPVAAVNTLGFASLPGEVSTRAGAAAVSGAALWTLVPSGSSCLTDELQPVATAHQGLVVTSRAALAEPCGLSAIESSGGLVGVAFPGHVRLFTSGGPRSGVDVPVARTASDTEFVPVSGASGAIWFLAGSGSGWSVFGVSPSGQVTGPSALPGFTPSSDPAVPGMSLGYLYTLDQTPATRQALWTINPSTGGMARVAGAGTYPVLNANEASAHVSFVGAQVIVDGPRVVFNNPQSHEAVELFTDGTHPPVIIDKNDAVELSATGPADVSVTPAASAPGNKRSGGASTSSGNASKLLPVVQPVNQQVTCATTTQKPYAPQITSISPSSGAALVSWSYQVLDQTDCLPDSWSVHVTALTGSHQPPQPLQVVNGQSQYLFTGLRPSTTYQAVVTAYINAQSTESTSATFITSARGPDAPLTVATKSDGRGDWVVSWQPCTGPAHPGCIVPADTWTITGSACGSSFVGQPPSVQVPGNRTSVTINSDPLGLLGDSVTFSVQGALLSGLTGNPTSDHGCTQAWRPPRPADISIGGSGLPTGQSITATLQVETRGSPVEAFGSQRTEFVYRVGRLTDGPTTATRVVIPGLAAGRVYIPTVTVYPGGHQASSVAVAGARFTRTLAWPAGLEVVVSPRVNPNPNTGTLIVSFPNSPPGHLTATATVQCGGPGGAAESVAGALINRAFSVANFDLDSMGGSCQLLGATLSDTDIPDPYGVSSPRLSRSFIIGQQPAYGFSAAVSAQCQIFCLQRQIDVNFGGPGTTPAAGIDWTIAACLTGSGLCSTSPPSTCLVEQTSAGPMTFPVALDVPDGCDPSAMTVAVTYTYLGSTHSVSVGPPSGTVGTTTTTSTTTSTTTTTVPPTSSTTACPPASTVAGSTTTTVACTPSRGAASGATSVPADPAVRSALGWGALALVLTWTAAAFTRLGRRSKKGAR